jgi:hypothetical protein
VPVGPHLLGRIPSPPDERDFELARFLDAEPDLSIDKIWHNPRVLNQKETGHCVGFGWADWSNTDPIRNSLNNVAGHSIYYECKVIDGEPKEENGSSVRSGAKAMQNRKRLGSYAFASSLHEIRVYLRQRGPIVVGTDWYDGMFEPDENAYVRPTGAVAGGHCYVILGDLVADKAFVCLNSWGYGWGRRSHFRITWADFDQLLQADGEACGGVELAL